MQIKDVSKNNGNQNENIENKKPYLIQGSLIKNMPTTNLPSIQRIQVKAEEWIFQEVIQNQ